MKKERITDENGKFLYILNTPEEGDVEGVDYFTLDDGKHIKERDELLYKILYGNPTKEEIEEHRQQVSEKLTLEQEEADKKRKELQEKPYKKKKLKKGSIMESIYESCKGLYEIGLMSDEEFKEIENLTHGDDKKVSHLQLDGDNPATFEKTKEILDALDSFLDLKNNWNSYNACLVSKECVELSKTIVKRLRLVMPVNFVYPLPDGGIQLESDKNGYHLEIEINPEPYDDYALLFSPNNATVYEKEVKTLDVKSFINDIYDILK